MISEQAAQYMPFLIFFFFRVFHQLVLSSSKNSLFFTYRCLIKFFYKSSRLFQGFYLFSRSYTREQALIFVYNDILMLLSRNPTPNIRTTAICVELTGSPKCVAIITVIAAAKDTQKALIISNSVISEPTVLTNFRTIQR